MEDYRPVSLKLDMPPEFMYEKIFDSREATFKQYAPALVLCGRACCASNHGATRATGPPHSLWRDVNFLSRFLLSRSFIGLRVSTVAHPTLAELQVGQGTVCAHHT